MEKRRNASDQMPEVKVADSVSEGFELAEDVRLAARLSDPDEWHRNVYQPFNNPQRARTLIALARKIENTARRTIGWPEI